MVFPISWMNTPRPNLPEMYQRALLSQPHPHPRAPIPSLCSVTICSRLSAFRGDSGVWRKDQEGPTLPRSQLNCWGAQGNPRVLLC